MNEEKKIDKPQAANSIKQCVSGELICCQCKYPSPDVWYQTYCKICGFDLPKQINFR